MKKILTIVLCSSLLILSCNKDKATITTPVNKEFKKEKELSSYYNGSLNGIDTFKYDEQGRISSVSYSKSIHMFEYVNSNEMKITSKIKATGEVDWIQTAKLNSKGAITEIVKHNTAGAVVDAYYYKYNADGYMISYKYVSPFYNNDVQERFFVIQNGNVVSAKSYQNAVHLQNYVYEYDLAKICRVPHTADYYWMSETLYGKPNSNPVKVQKTYKATDGTLTFHAVYSLVYNAQANMLEESIQYPLSGTNGSRSYKF